MNLVDLFSRLEKSKVSKQHSSSKTSISIEDRIGTTKAIIHTREARLEKLAPFAHNLPIFFTGCTQSCAAVLQNAPNFFRRLKNALGTPTGNTELRREFAEKYCGMLPYALSLKTGVESETYEWEDGEEIATPVQIGCSCIDYSSSEYTCYRQMQHDILQEILEYAQRAIQIAKKRRLDPRVWSTVKMKVSDIIEHGFEESVITDRGETYYIPKQPQEADVQELCNNIKLGLESFAIALDQEVTIAQKNSKRNGHSNSKHVGETTRNGQERQLYVEDDGQTIHLGNNKYKITSQAVWDVLDPLFDCQFEGKSGPFNTKKKSLFTSGDAKKLYTRIEPDEYPVGDPQRKGNRKYTGYAHFKLP